jgi:hypothetical protein
MTLHWVTWYMIALLVLGGICVELPDSSRLGRACGYIVVAMMLFAMFVFPWLGDDGCSP